MLGVSEENLSNTAGTASSKTNFISYLVKPQFPITEQATVYGLIGATTAKMTVSITGSPNTSHTKTQASFGAGLEYNVQDAVSIGVEYVQYSNKSDNTANFKAKIRGISASVNYHF